MVLDPRVMARVEAKGPRRRRSRSGVREETLRRGAHRSARDPRRDVLADRRRSSERREAVWGAREPLSRSVRRRHRSRAFSVAFGRLSESERAERREGRRARGVCVTCARPRKIFVACSLRLAESDLSREVEPTGWRLTRASWSIATDAKGQRTSAWANHAVM